MATKETLKDFYGRIIGTIETAPNGDRTIKDFYGRILGKYEKARNVTKDFYGRIIGTGDLLTTLLR